MSYIQYLRVFAACVAVMASATALAAQTTGSVERRAEQQRAQPLIVIDGVVLREGTTLPDLSALSIESVEVIKGDRALELYGPRAAHGVLVIRTHDRLTADSIAALQRQWETARIRIQSPVPAVGSEPLIIIDGVVIGRGVRLDLDTMRDQISRIEIIKGAAAVYLYGERATHGVIIVTTKRD